MKVKLHMLLPSTIFLLLSTFTIVNMMQMPYHSPLRSAEPDIINLTLFSKDCDEILVYATALTLLALFVLHARFKRTLRMTVLACVFAMASAVTLNFEAHTTSQLFIIFAGFISLTQMAKAESQKGKSSDFLKWQAICLLLSITAIESIAIISWLLIPFINPKPSNTILWGIVNLESQLFHIPEFLITPLFLAFAFSWLISIVNMKKRVKGLKLKVTIFERKFQITIYERKIRSGVNVKNSKISSATFLALSLILAIIFVYYPYLPKLIPEGKYVGVDVKYYFSWLNDMQSQNGVPKLLGYVFQKHPDRPLSLLFIFSLWKLSQAPLLDAVKYTPLILAPLLLMSIYLFASDIKDGGGNANFAALLASFSYTVTVGLICAFYANWLCLAIVYLYIKFLIKNLNNPSLKHLGITLAASAAMLFTHAFTWAMFMGITLVHFSITILKDIKLGKPSKQLKALATTLAFNAILDILKTMIVPEAKTTAVQALSLAENSFSIQNMANFLSLTNRDLTEAMLGFFINPPMLALALLGAAYTALTTENQAYNYLNTTLFASSLAFIAGGWLMHIRILYNLPIPIYAAIGISKTLNNSGESIKPTRLKTLMIVLLTIMNINYALRCSYTAHLQMRTLQTSR